MQVKCTRKCRSHVQRRRHDTLDTSLLESVIEGDKAAFRVLFIRHSVSIYRFVLRLTGDTSIAEEVVGDVFLEVWRHAARFEMRSQVSTWLFAIARHKALATLRRRSEWQLDDEECLLTIEDPADDPEVCLDKQDRGSTLRLCLQQLSPAHREVIDLVYYRGKSVAMLLRSLESRQAPSKRECTMHGAEWQRYSNKRGSLASGRNLTDD